MIQSYLITLLLSRWSSSHSDVPVRSFLGRSFVLENFNQLTRCVSLVILVGVSNDDDYVFNY